jgi:hypothetical protein
MRRHKFLIQDPVLIAGRIIDISNNEFIISQVRVAFNSGPEGRRGGIAIKAIAIVLYYP